MFNKVVVGLIGHEYRYEVFQILSLFYNKDDIFFCKDDLDNCNIISIADKNIIKCVIKTGENVKEEKVTLLNTDKKSIKNAIKTVLLEALQRETGIKIPWGILVGIRPTKIIHEYKKENLSDSEIFELFSKKYSLETEKAKLTMEVAANEEKFLKVSDKSVSLYIGIPFCPSRCAYCSFTSNSVCGNTELVEQYTLSLYNEIDSVLDELKNKEISIDTLYIGGGTPTSLSSISLDRLFSVLSSHIDLKNLREFTVEAGRPDSIDHEKLGIIKAYGAGRISINPQTMNEETLKVVGRKHTVNDIIEKYNMARDIGFNNINMDIIIGLPGEGINEIQHTMDEISILNPDSITIHTMAVKRASKLNQQKYLAKNKDINEMYALASSRVRDLGMFPYYMYRQKNMISPLENVGYCKQNKECIYNIQMIAENITIIALGADAVSKIVFNNENRIERYANLKDVHEYIKRTDEMINKKKEAISLI